MGDAATTLLGILLAFVGVTVGLAVGIFLLVKLFGLVWVVLAHVFRFIGDTLKDTVRLIGAIITVPVFALFVVLSVIIGRWSASAHYGRAFATECKAGGLAVYRLIVGNPARLVGLGGALEGIEQRIPQAMADAPGRDKPSRRVGMFDGYRVIGSLKGGGSGAKLYVAEPDDVKRAALARRGMGAVDRVVIKVFSQQAGSTLDQIVRESRALEAAKELGLVLEHASEPQRFYYVMRHVPGDSLALVTQRLHTESHRQDGLDERGIAAAMGFASDLVSALSTYHAGGLWHKDVKPDNIIIDDGGSPSSGRPRAHLVDFGLVTPMKSAMTLTTHGTEYFRDPELVRQALRGVKVSEIDGRKFDLYAAGAVLYSMLENSFPAHGGLSQISRRCPEALRWIVRRAMTDYDKRYETAEAMWRDLEAVRVARDPFALRPADLPSVRGVPAHDRATPPPIPTPPPVPATVRRESAGTPVPQGRPEVRVKNWWTGGAAVGHRAVAEDSGRKGAGGGQRYAAVNAGGRRPASEQLASARQRVRVTRKRARERIERRRASQRNHTSGVNAGMIGALLLFLLALGAGVVGAILLQEGRGSHPHTVVRVDPDVEIRGGVRVKGDHDHPEHSLADFHDLDARVLVLSDLGVQTGNELRGQVLDGLDALRETGIETVGELSPESGMDEAQEIALLATMRTARGARPFDADDLPDVVRRALVKINENWSAGDSVDAVLWIGTEPGDAQRVRYVFAEPNYAISSYVDAQTAATIVGRLAAHGHAVHD